MFLNDVRPGASIPIYRWRKRAMAIWGEYFSADDNNDIAVTDVIIIIIACFTF